jgi:hypothetical protein
VGHDALDVDRPGAQRRRFDDRPVARAGGGQQGQVGLALEQLLILGTAVVATTFAPG